MDQRNHLSEQELVSYLLGQASLLEQETAEQHLAECDACSSRAIDCNPSDQFVQLLVRSQQVSDVASLRTLDDPPTLELGCFSKGASADGKTEPMTGNIRIGVPPELKRHPRYRIVRFLGCGGMGSVWLAEHQVMRRQVALKLIRPELAMRQGVITRFLREVEMMAKLNHPNVATAYDAEQVGGVFFLVMEYVPGQPLSAAVKDGALAVSEACRAIRDAALGLAHAHAMGLIHRDVKPGNLIRTTDGSVKLVDFGLAAALGNDSSLTMDNIVMGTADYVAPEQAINPRAADARADIYSLGCSLYQLLSGRVLYPDMSMVAKIDAHRSRAPDPLTTLPPGLWPLLSRMIAKDPAMRVQSALEVATQLVPFCSSSECGLATLENPVPRSLRVGDPKKWQVGLLLTMLCGVLWLASVWNQNPARNPEASSKIAPVDAVAEPSAIASVSAQLAPVDDLKITDPEASYHEHRGAVTGVEFDSVSKSLFSCGEDGWIFEWDLTSHRVKSHIEVGVPIRAMARIPSERSLLIATDNRLRRIDLDRKQPDVDLPPVPNDRIFGIAISPDGLRAATCSLDRGMIRTWDLVGNKLERSWTIPAPDLDRIIIYAVAWSPDGQRIATAGDAGVFIWNPNSGTQDGPSVTTSRDHSLAYSSDGKQLYVGGFHTAVQIFELPSRRAIETLEGTEQLVIRLVSDSRLLTRYGSEMALWDLKSNRKLLRLVGGTPELFRISASSDGRWLASGDYEGTVYIFRNTESD